MIAIKFNVPFEINYEGWVYRFVPEKIVKVEDDVFAFLTDRVPLAFEKVEGKNVQFIPKAEMEKAVPWTRPQKRGIFGGDPPSRNMAVFGGTNHVVAPTDLTPPSGTVDSDGVGWYGEGVVRSK